jgi:hypothetical protein
MTENREYREFGRTNAEFGMIELRAQGRSCGDGKLGR